LKGFPEAIEAIYPNTVVQTCVVHAVLHSGWTLHNAPKNHTDQIRWAITSYRVPVGVAYTGAAGLYTRKPFPWLDALGIEPGGPLDHPVLPIVTA
jgi:hypothetical protein